MANVDDPGFFEPDEFDDDFHEMPGSPIAIHERVEVKDVVGLLRTRLAVLTGGKDKGGAWLITFPASGQSKGASDITFDKFKQVLTYLVQNASADPEQDMFSAVIDARQDAWNYCKFIVKGLDHFLVGRIRAVYIIEPSGFWSKRTNTVGFKKIRAQLTFETVLLASPSKLGRYIEMNQLTEELGGFLPYKHEEWIDIHLSYDRFIGNTQHLYQDMDQHHADLSSSSLPGSVSVAEEMLEKHHYLHGDVTALPRRFQSDGQDLLNQILQPQSAQKRNLSPDLSHIVTRVQHQLEKIRDKRELLEEVWDLRLNQLEQCLQVKEFEEAANQAIGWFEGPGDSFLLERTPPVGFSKPEAERLMHEHISFNSQAEKYFNQLSKLQMNAEQYIEENHYAIPEIRGKLQHMDSVVRHFKKRIAVRGQQLALSAKFHSTADSIDDLLYDLGLLCSADHIVYDVEAAEQMVSKLRSTLDEASSLLELLQQLGEGVFDLLQGGGGQDGRGPANPRRENVTTFRKVSRHFFKRIDELQQRKKSCHHVVDEKKNKLEQFLQLKSCEEDAKKIIEWLHKAADLVQASQSDLGDSIESIGDLEQEHTEFSTKAKATYENGIQLINTGQVLREACELPAEPGMEQLQQLDAAWNAVTAGIEGRTERLALSARAHRGEAEVSRQLVAIRDELRQQIDVHSVSDVEQLLEQSANLWATVDLQYEDTKVSVQALVEDLTVELSSEVPLEMTGEVQSVCRMLNEKMAVLTAEWTAVQQEWLQRRDKLQQLLGIKEFRQACSEVMSWIRTETENLAVRNSFGGSLESARRLSRETEEFQKDINIVYDRVCKLTAVAKKEVDGNSFCKEQFEAGALELDLAWKELSVRLLHWQSLLGMAVSFYERADNVEHRLALVAKSFRTVQLERTYEGMQSLLTQHGRLRDQFTEVTQQTLNEGEALVQRLEHPEKELIIDDQGDIAAVDYSSAIKEFSGRMRKLRDESENVEDMWTARKKALQQALQLRLLEGRCRVVASATDEQVQSLHTSPLELSISAAGLLLLQEQHAQLEAAAKHVVRKMAEVTDEADGLVKSGHYASAEIKQLRKSLGQRVGRMARAVLQRREVLGHGVKFQKKANEWVLYMDELQGRMTTSVMSTTRESLIAMTEDHRAVRQEIECTGEELQRESHAFMSAVTGLVTTDCMKIEGFLGRMRERILQLKAMWQERQRQLEVGREGYDYKDKVQETVEWVHRTAWDFFSTHRQMGHDLDSAQRKLREYEVFEEESKVIHNRVIVLYQQVDNVILGGDVGTDVFKYESERLLGEWQHFLNHLDKSSQLLILYLSFHNAARQFSLLLSEYEAFIEDLNEQVLHQQSTRETDAQLERCHQQTRNNASETEVRLRSFIDMATQYTVQISKTWPCLDTQPASIAAARLWTELKDREEQLEAVWKMKKGYVEQETEIQNFQQQTQKLLGWLHARGDAFFQQYGPAPPVDVQQAKQRQTQLVKFQQEADEHLRRAATLLSEGEQLIQLQYQDSSPIQSLVEQLRHGLEQFTRRITQYRTTLGSTLEFHQQKDELVLELRHLREDMKTKDIPEDAIDVGQMKAEYEQRWGRCETIMERLGVLVVDMKAHYGRQTRQKNPAASLDHLKVQFRQCSELLEPLLEKLARTLKAAEFFTDVAQVKAELREKAEAFFCQPLVLGNDVSVVNQQQQALNNFEDEILGVLTHVQEVVDEGNRRMMSDHSASSVISIQLESLQEAAHFVSAQIGERRDILEICSIFHKHADKANEWCEDAAVQFREAKSRGLSPDATADDVQLARHLLHAFFSRMEALQRGQLRSISELASQVPTDEAQTVADKLIDRSKEMMEQYRKLDAQLVLCQEKLGSSTSVKHGVVMETEEEADSIFVSEESETSLEPFYEDDSPNEMPPDRPPAPVRERKSILKRKNVVKRKNSDKSKRHSSAFSALVASTFGPFSGSFQQDSLDEVAQEESPPAIPPRPKMFPPAQEIVVDDRVGVQPANEGWDGSDDETDAGGESAKEARKAFKKVGYVLEELVTTEREYVDKLSVIVKGFLPEMSSNQVPTILENKKDIIFANVEEIYNFHKVFVRDLEQFQNNPQQACMCFIREESKFWAYFPYCKNKARSQRVLDEYGGSFFDEIQKKLGLPLPLSSYLLEPIQRMTRYQLLLKQLVKYAEQARLDCASELQNAVNAMLRVPRTANDALNFELLVGCDMDLDERLLLLQETFLVWVSRPGEKVKKRGGQEMQVFLHEDVVIFSKKEVEGKSAEQQQRYVFKNSLKTTAMGLVENYRQGTNHQPDKAKFALTCGHSTVNSEQFVLQPSCQDQKKGAEVKKIWVEELSNLLRRQLEAEKAKQKEIGGMQRTLHPLHVVSEAHPPEEIFQKPQAAAPQHDTSSALARPLSRTLSGTGSEGGVSDIESPSRSRDIGEISIPSLKPDEIPNLEVGDGYFAVHAYEPSDSSEVPLQVGQRVEVLDVESKLGWCLVCTEATDTELSAEGFVPAHYIAPEKGTKFGGGVSRKGATAHAQPPMPPILEEKRSMQHSSGDHFGMVASPSATSLTNLSRTSETLSHASTIGSHKVGGKLKGSKSISSPIISSIERSSTSGASSTSTIAGLGEEDFVVQYDYNADEESQTSVRRGDVVTVLDTSMHDWWLVSVPELEDSAASEGYVPAKCLAKSQPPPVEESETSPGSKEQDTSSQHSGSSNESEIPPSLPPKRRTSSQSAQPVSEQPSPEVVVELRQKPPVSYGIELPKNIYIVQRNYTGEDENQVTVMAGQKVEAIDTTTIPGWYMVEVEGNEMEGGQEGMIPSEFLGKTMPVIESSFPRESEGVSERSLRGSDVTRGEPNDKPEDTAEVEVGEVAEEVRKDDVLSAPPVVMPANEDEIPAVIPAEEVGQKKANIQLNFQSELAAVLRRKLRSPTVDRRTLYKSTFLSQDPTHSEPTDEQLESLPRRGHFYYAVAAYCPDDGNQLPLFEGQRIEIIDWSRNDWWLARIPNPVTTLFVEGWVPSTYLKDQETYEQEQAATRSHAVIAELQNKAKGNTIDAADMYRAIADFVAEHTGTISMTEGDLFKVLHQREGWWLVRPEREGETPEEGWVPASYLEKAVDRPIEEPDVEDADYVEQLNLAADFIKQILGDNWQTIDDDSLSSTSDEGSTGPVSITQVGFLPEVKASPAQRSSAAAVGGDRSATSSPIIATEGDTEHAALMKRLYVLEELRQTEKEYVHKLDYVLRNYDARMNDLMLPPFLQDKREDLFANIEEIFEFHSTVFLNELLACGDDALAVGRCFVDWEVKLQQLYVTYCKNKPRSDAVLQDPSKSFFDMIQGQLKDKHRHNISDYLILPVQRITKYQLLLQDLVKYTARAGEDTKALKTAFDGCVDVPRRANNAIALSMLVTKENIEEKYGDLLLQDSFVVIEKRRGNDRHVFLFERLVMFCKIKRESLPGSSSPSFREKITYLQKTRIHMDTVMLTTSVDNDPCKFMVTAGKNNEKYILKARKRSIRDAWVKEIQNLLASQLLEVKSALQLRRQISPGMFSPPVQSPVPLSERKSKSATLPILPRTASQASIDSVAVTDGKSGTSSTRSSLSRSSMRNIQKQANLSWVGLTRDSNEEEQETRRQAFSKKRGELPAISIQLVQASEEAMAQTQPAVHIVVGETYVVNEDIAVQDDELLLSDGEHVRVLSGDGQGKYLVETKDGESGWISQQHLRDERQSDAMKSREPPILSASSDTVSCRKGERACLRLSLTASPKVDIKWYLENEELVEGGRYCMSSEQNSAILEIASVTSDDNGVYKCVASNDLGLDACSISLEVQDVPGPPGPVQVCNIMAKSAQLNWAPPAYSGNVAISHFTVEKRVGGDSPGQWEEVSSCCRDTQKVVFQLDSGVKYQFRVCAVNVIGKGPPNVSPEIATRYRLPSTDGGASPYMSRRVEVKEQPVEDYYRMQDELAV